MKSHGNDYLDSIAGGRPDDQEVANEAGGVAGKIEYRCDLLDPIAILNIAHIMYEGDSKGRAPDGWRKLPASTHINHALTHLMLHMAGSKTEDHIGRALTRVMMAVAIERQNKSKRKDGPNVICLCGSTKFKKEYLEAGQVLSLASNIILTVEFFAHADGHNLTIEQKELLDKL